MDAAHRDPFDRMLAAQALLDGLIPRSRDPMMNAMGYGPRSVARPW
jgi:PIN domain nuclease of toxin-antitoxin system